MATEKPKQKKYKKALKVLAALMGVFLLIGCCSVGGLMFLGSESTLTTPVPTKLPSPMPTLTEVPPTTPTSVLVPSPTVDNTSDYREEMYRLLKWYTEAQEKVAELNQQAGQNLQLFDDSSWTTEMGFALGQLLVIGEEIRALDPPSEFEEIHGFLVKSTEHLDTFVDLYTRGVDTLDADLIIQASGELELATDWMNKAAEAMPD